MSNDMVFKGDDTSSFNKNFIKIDIRNPNGFIISKAIFVCGCIKKVYNNPSFPIIINFDSKESQLLRPVNIGYLVVYDENGKQRTCNNILKFKAKNGVIYHG